MRSRVYTPEGSKYEVFFEDKLDGMKQKELEKQESNEFEG